eukprot:gene11310-15171_t
MEDSFLHPGLPIIMWLMLAVSKKFEPPAFLVRIVIDIVRDIANCIWKDIPYSLIKYENVSEKCKIDNNKNSITSSDDNNDNNNKSILAFPSSQLTLVISLMLRASYGGMSCDILMLQKYYLLWFTRFTFDSKDFNNKMIKIEINDKSITNNLSYFCDDYIYQLIGQNTPDNNSKQRYFWGEYLVNSCCINNCDNNDSNNSNNGSDHKSDKNIIICNSIDVRNNILDIQLSDVLPEGIDFHCDYQLINHILTNCKSQLNNNNINLINIKNDSTATNNNLIEAIKSAIWYYRSSTNYHKIITIYDHNLLNDVLLNELVDPNDFIAFIENEKLMKKEYGPLWMIICSTVCKYTRAKATAFYNRLKMK